jgi:NitT/TauT family transport system ATP-binding protein
LTRHPFNKRQCEEIHAVEMARGGKIPGRPAIALDGVTIEFATSSGSIYTAVENVSLDVEAGEFIAIVGPTGCGKSTILNVVAGLLTPARGSVTVMQAPLSGVTRNAGYLFQQDALFPWKTSIDNVALGLEIAGVATSEARARASQWLARVGLRGFEDRYPHMLSGGQRKRVGLAQVLIREPGILLMDEPFGPLDAQTRQIMGNLLLDLWSARRQSVLFVTHDLEEAIALSDRVIILSSGPSARVLGEWRIEIERPRDIAEVKHEARFRDLHREIWHVLRDEVIRGYERTGGG